MNEYMKKYIELKKEYEKSKSKENTLNMFLFKEELESCENTAAKEVLVDVYKTLAYFRSAYKLFDSITDKSDRKAIKKLQDLKYYADRAGDYDHVRRPKDATGTNGLVVDFNYDEEEAMFVAEVNDITFVCEELMEEFVGVAKKIAECYDNKLAQIAEFISEETKEFYGDKSQNEIMNALGSPQIDLGCMTITYLNHTLDQEHIIEMEYDGVLEEFYNLSIDG